MYSKKNSIKDQPMQIIEYPLNLDKSFIIFLNNVDGLNFSQYKELSKDDLIKIFDTELKMIKIRNYDPKMFLLTKNDLLSGLITIENLEWDTSIFGIKMGRYVHTYLTNKCQFNNVEMRGFINHALDEFKKRKIEHISIKSDANNWMMIKTLQSMGFILMDTLIDYSFDLRKDKVNNFDSDSKIRSIKEDDIESVINLCRNIYSAFQYDRFHRETLFQRENSTNLYVEWIKNQIYRDAEEITIAEKDGEIVGFSALKVYNEVNKDIKIKFADMILNGVSESVRGMNIFTSMIKNQLLYGKMINIGIMKTTCHVSNISVQRSLIKMGFKPSYVQHTFHKILN